MSRGHAVPAVRPSAEEGESTDVRTVARRFGALNVLAGLLGFVGPAIENDDDGLVNTEPGLFLGHVAVNWRHALVHVLYGALGLLAGRGSGAARGYLGLGSVLFGVLSVMGWRAFGFRRGVNMVAGMAMDGWANVAHALLAAFCLARAVRRSS